MAVTNDDVYLAGGFLLVGGEFHAGFAAVDANTGAVDSNFIMNVGNSANAGQLARGIVVTSDGNSVFGLHYGTNVNGDDREAIAKIDTSGNNAVLADWRVNWSDQTNLRVCLDSLRDIAISPDDSFIVVGGQGADNPPNCDSVLRYPTVGTGVIGFDWSARLYSSVFSVAVSDVAVYVGGHFCAAPLNGAPPGGQTHERTNGTANRCNINDPNDSDNPSVIFPNDAVFRKQLAALDPSDGRALEWNPGSNAFLGTLDITLIDRGLLAGMDEDRYNDILTGRSGFFDFGGFTPPAPAPAVAACVVEVINNVPVVSYSDFADVSNVNILRNGSWIVTHTSETPGTGTYEDTTAVTGVAYSYVIRSRPGGVVNDVACSPGTITIVAPPPPPDDVCSVEAAAVGVTVTWQNKPGTEVLRNAGGWVATPPAGTLSYDDPGGSLNDGWLIRRSGVDEVCEIVGDPPPPPPDDVCSVAEQGAGVLITWQNKSGREIVRNDDGWVTTPANGELSYSDPNGSVDDGWFIRRTRGGGDEVCDII
jgi:hypothetical protein